MFRNSHVWLHVNLLIFKFSFLVLWRNNNWTYAILHRNNHVILLSVVSSFKNRQTMLPNSYISENIFLSVTFGVRNKGVACKI